MNIDIKHAGIIAGIVVTLIGGLALVFLSQWLNEGKSPSEVAQEAAFQAGWDRLTEDKREEVCFGATLLGPDTVAAILASETDGTPIDAAYVAERITEECAK